MLPTNKSTLNILVSSTSLILTNPLTNLFNYCIVIATYPKVLKFAEIIPVFKSGGKKICSKYRPISSLLSFSQIYEIVCTIKFIAFLQLKNFNIDLGKKYLRKWLFQKFVITFSLTSKINKLLDLYFWIYKNLSIQVIITIMLKLKLQAHGVRGLPLQLLQSYLTSRSQCTIVNRIQSSFPPMFCGIPQCFTLEPNFYFNIYE